MDIKSCKPCLFLEYGMWKALVDAIEESRTDANTKSVDDALRYIADSLECFHLFQGHRARVCNQQNAKAAILRDMYDEVACTKKRGTQGFLTIDWAMNYEGERKNESMVHNFGKRGYAWHICHVSYYDYDSEEDKPVLVQVTLDQLPNNDNKKCGMGVLSFVEACMMKISHEIPHLKLLHHCSDNASNYHKKELVLAIPVLNAMSLSVKIGRSMHTETQDGKGGCDSHSANAKRHVRKTYLLSRDESTEYRKVDTPKQLATAIAYDGGIQNNGKHLGVVNETVSVVLAPHTQLVASTDHRRAVC